MKNIAVTIVNIVENILRLIELYMLELNRKVL